MTSWFLIMMATILSGSLYSAAQDWGCERLMKRPERHWIVDQMIKRGMEHTDYHDGIVIYPDHGSAHALNQVAAEIEEEFGLILIFVFNRSQELKSEGLLESPDNLLILDPEHFFRRMDQLKPEVFKLGVKARAAFHMSASFKDWDDFYEKRFRQ